MIIPPTLVSSLVIGAVELLRDVIWEHVKKTHPAETEEVQHAVCDCIMQHIDKLKMCPPTECEKEAEKNE